MWYALYCKLIVAGYISTGKLLVILSPLKTWMKSKYKELKTLEVGTDIMIHRKSNHIENPIWTPSLIRSDSGNRCRYRCRLGVTNSRVESLTVKSSQEMSRDTAKKKNPSSCVRLVNQIMETKKERNTDSGTYIIPSWEVTNRTENGYVRSWVTSLSRSTTESEDFAFSSYKTNVHFLVRESVPDLQRACSGRFALQKIARIGHFCATKIGCCKFFAPSLQVIFEKAKKAAKRSTSILKHLVGCLLSINFQDWILSTREFATPNLSPRGSATARFSWIGSIKEDARRKYVRYVVYEHHLRNKKLRRQQTTMTKKKATANSNREPPDKDNEIVNAI